MISDSAIDIDWFAQDEGGNVIHFASGGGRIPRMVKSIDYELLISYFNGLPAKSLNVKYGTRLSEFVALDGSELNAYLGDFRRMSQRGLFSFDKSNLGNSLDNKYHLVCAPELPLGVNDLPESIRTHLIKLNLQANKTVQVDLTEIL